MIVRTYEEDEFSVHRIPLLMMAGVIVITLALTISVRLGWFDRQAVPEDRRAVEGVVAEASRSLFFVDEDKGIIRVEDAQTGEMIARYQTNQGGFVRSTARSLITARQVRGIGPEVPFELIRWNNGTLTLRDSETGRAVELSNFGGLNHEIYANMLPQESTQ